MRLKKKDRHIAALFLKERYNITCDCQMNTNAGDLCGFEDRASIMVLKRI